jgi:hypothetical protein
MVELKPELIAKREIISTSILVEGNPRFLMVSQDPFADVQLEIADQEAVQERKAKWLISVLSALAALNCFGDRCSYLLYLSMRESDHAVLMIVEGLFNGETVSRQLLTH